MSILTWDEKNISKGQVYKIHESIEFARFVEDIENPGSSKQILKAIELKNVYQTVEVIFFISNYYNKVLINENAYAFNDYYGFFKSGEATKENIGEMKARYDLDNDVKFDIKVNVQVSRRFFIQSDGKLKKLERDWYYNPNDAIEYFSINSMNQELTEEQELKLKSLDISRVDDDFVMIPVYSSLRDGIDNFDESCYSTIKNGILDKGFIIKEE